MPDGSEEHLKYIRDLEASIKQYVDMQSEMQIQREILDDMKSTLLTQTVNGQSPITDLTAHFQAEFQRKQAEYQARSDQEKYNDAEPYQEFRSKVLDKQNPGNVEEEGDDGLMIVSQNISLECPITRKLFKEPYTTKCKHTFEKAAIMAVIQTAQVERRRAECPYAGCNKYISLSDLRLDRDIQKQAARKMTQLEAEQEAADEEYTYMD
ncbi:zinc-finger of the MIZ type in Nse subunit-domain-containing protein [Gaertneriomyces semiglobifer]|nr:zinc-finger of the MIZ type in Nse subunit-domain-containing protein [Gaertneriomyces semiglobifer]